EVSASAVECAVDVVLRISIESRFKVRRPIVATQTHVMTTGEGNTIEEAVDAAVRSMRDLLVEQLQIGDVESAMLMSTAGDVRFGLAGYPPYTVVVAMPRSIASL